MRQAGRELPGRRMKGRLHRGCHRLPADAKEIMPSS
jgi:hypothetical protein